MSKSAVDLMHPKDADRDVWSNQPGLPSLDLTPKKEDGRKQVGANKLSLQKRKSDFALTSYNSAFLEGLFEDIANSNVPPSTTNKGEGEEAVAKEGPEAPEPTISVALPSDHNLVKRRRVSTNKSLGRCGQSLANLADLKSTVRKKSSVLISEKAATSVKTTKKEFPATVSAASYSLPLDLGSQGQAESEQNKNDQNHEGAFGWFIDMDDQEDHEGFHQGHAAASGHDTDVPLAFSAPIAPRAASQDVQAQVEWAQAADTVDEVLGDLF